MIEASFIAGTDQINQIREKFSESGIRYLGIKLGGKGCYVTDFTEEQYIPLSEKYACGRYFRSW